MDIKILGPLEVRENCCSVVLTAAKPRQMLALLAANAGGFVPVRALAEELWGGRPPRSASTTLQTYVLKLRTAISATGGRSAKEVLVTASGGYRLDIAAEDVDAGRFERLAASGDRAVDLGDDEAAARLLRSALAVWRGQALVDVHVGSLLGAEVIRLEEDRTRVLENRIQADLKLGRHQALIAELAVLRARYPMHENLCAMHMIALYRCGRQWQALEAYTTLRNTLVAELGMEPAPRLRQLHHLVLDADSELEFGGPVVGNLIAVPNPA